jgi:hypothetical protein
VDAVMNKPTNMLKSLQNCRDMFKPWYITVVPEQEKFVFYVSMIMGSMKRSAHDS